MPQLNEHGAGRVVVIDPVTGEDISLTGSYVSLGYEQITSMAASTAMTVPSGATIAVIQNNGTQAVRWRPDGSSTAPTTTSGQKLAAGGTLTLDLGETTLNAARFIEEAAGAILDIMYYA